MYVCIYKYIHTHQDFLSQRKISNLNFFGKKIKIPEGGLQMVLWEQMTSQDL